MFYPVLKKSIPDKKLENHMSVPFLEEKNLFRRGGVAKMDLLL